MNFPLYELCNGTVKTAVDIIILIMLGRILVKIVHEWIYDNIYIYRRALYVWNKTQKKIKSKVMKRISGLDLENEWLINKS